MDSLSRDDLEKLSDALNEMFAMSKNQINCVSTLIRNPRANEEPLCNIALYHLAVWVKTMIWIICFRFEITYSKDDSIEDLLNNASLFLPEHILAMEKDICYWHDDVQYKSKNVKTDSEVTEIAKMLERYFNNFIRVYAQEIKQSILQSMEGTESGQ